MSSLNFEQPRDLLMYRQGGHIWYVQDHAWIQVLELLSVLLERGGGKACWGKPGRRKIMVFFCFMWGFHPSFVFVYFYRFYKAKKHSSSIDNEVSTADCYCVVKISIEKWIAVDTIT